MTAAKRIDPDRTTEMEIPPQIKENIEKLKKERQSITQKIEETKTEAEVRKVDESTVVFNLRQHQLHLKVEELEQKKAEAEKELNHLLQGKNVKLHNDMRKVAQFLINEVKKITPLNKDIHEKVTELSSLKQELQEFQQEQKNVHSKANDELLKQGSELRALSELLHQTTKHLREDFDKAVQELEILRKEKASEEKNLIRVREDLAQEEVKLHGFSLRQEELQKIQKEVSELKPKLLQLEKTEAALEEIVREIHDQELKKEGLQKEIVEINEEHRSKLEAYRVLEGNYHKLENKIQSTELEMQRKLGMLSSLNQELLDYGRRIEASRLQEMEILNSCRNELTSLSRIQGEIAQIEGRKTIALEMQKETSRFFEQEKENLEGQLKILNEHHKSRLGELQAEFELRKLEWEKEFLEFSSMKEAELHDRLGQIETERKEEMSQRKREFTRLVSSLIKTQLTRPEFSSLDQKLGETEKEVDRFYESFFGPPTKKRFWFW